MPPSAAPYPLIEYELGRADVSAALTGWDRSRPGRVRRLRWWLALGALGGGLGSFFGAVLAGLQAELWWLVALLFVLGALFGLAVVAAMQFLTRAQGAVAAVSSGAVPLGPQRLWLDAEGVHHDRPGMTSMVRWEEIAAPIAVGNRIVVPLATSGAEVPVAMAVVAIVASPDPGQLAALWDGLQARGRGLERAGETGRNPSPILSGEVTARDYEIYNRRFLQTPEGRRERTLTVVTAAGLGAFAGFFALAPLLGSLLAIALGAGVSAGLILLILRGTTENQTQSLVRSGAYRTGASSWWFDDGRFHGDVGGARVSADWGMIRSVEQTEGLGLVWLGPAMAVLVPMSIPGAAQFLGAVEQRRRMSSH